MTTLYAVLPYLATADRFPIGGVEFRSSSDTEGLAQEHIEHLSTIGSMLCLAQGKPVDAFAYAVVDLPDQKVAFADQMDRVRAAHTILTYVLSYEWQDSLEQCSLFGFMPKEVFDFLSPTPVPGYALQVNWGSREEVLPSTRLYPPVPVHDSFVPPTLRLSDLRYELDRHYYLRGLESFVYGRILDKPEQRARYQQILRAMSWYNRTFAHSATEQDRIVSLATAYEVLFHDPSRKDRRIPDEIKSALSFILGSTPRIGQWVEQFYDARSALLHEGTSDNVYFEAREGLKTGPLLHYGRRLLRLCIASILFGTLIAEEHGIDAWLLHDTERLEAVCKHLTDKARPPGERWDAMVRVVYDLSKLSFSQDPATPIEYKTVHTAGRLILQHYRELYPESASKVNRLLDCVLELSAEDRQELIVAYNNLALELSRGIATLGDGRYRGRPWPISPDGAVALFAEFASDHYFRWQALRDVAGKS